ncbi:MAG: (E)-4-hydroxy-3-methylbut-2-enyl-diphosphate synthase [Leptonema sp. (in: bacteria)]
MVTVSLKELTSNIIKASREMNYQGKFFLHPFTYKRFPTRKVKIGNLYIGGDEPIRIQSMTTTPTLEIQSTFLQAKQLFDVGCEIVRITTRNPKEARAIQEIKSLLLQEGYKGPIVADVHFSPEVAYIVADYADKVRINPGNFGDSKKFEKKEYTDLEYEQELGRIHDLFKPLVLKLKEKGKSLRIGANHGSLSDRILNRFGDTPQGMVESVMEYMKIAEYYDFKDIVISLKASNPYVMILAYKMLIERFLKENKNYPIHLGVTEAGDGKDGRFKSASGIGLLLLEGIGDTIRVSLTEDPTEEIPAAKEILNFVEKIRHESESLYSILEKYSLDVNYPYEIKRNRSEIKTNFIGGKNPVKWIISFETKSFEDKDFVDTLLKNLPDFFLIQENQIKDFNFVLEAYPELKKIKPILKTNLRDFLKNHNLYESYFCLWVDVSLQEEIPFGEFQKFDFVVFNFIFEDISEFLLKKFKDVLKTVQTCENLLFSFEFHKKNLDIIKFYRSLNYELKTMPPFVLQIILESPSLDLLKSAILGAGSIYSNLGDVLFVKSESAKKSFLLGSDILQNTRLRLSRADFISCPSCGRTLFDLQTTTQKIKELTNHLAGVKIAIMGCIVNGLGEMADADFGYVGASPGKVNLYRGKELIKKNVAEEDAPYELVRIIKDAGMWKEKE